MNNLSDRLIHYVIAIVILAINLIAAHANADLVKYAVSVDEHLADLLPRSCYFSGRFTEQKQLVGLSEPLLSQGRLMFACDRGLTWYTEVPIKEALIYSLSRQHFFYSQTQQSIKPLTGRLHNNIGKLLVSIMGADTGYIDQHFKLIDESRVDKPYRFVPRKKAMKKFISELRLQKIGVNGDATIVIEFNQPDVGSTRLTIAQVQYHGSGSMIECLSVLRNQKICQRFLILNNLTETNPYDNNFSSQN
jgi:hypothetical protein